MTSRTAGSGQPRSSHAQRAAGEPHPRFDRAFAAVMALVARLALLYPKDQVSSRDLDPAAVGGGRPVGTFGP